MTNEVQLRWVKASERLPELEVFSRYTPAKFNGMSAYGYFHKNDTDKMVFKVVNGEVIAVVKDDNFDKLFWLEEYTQPLPEQKETPKSERKSIGIRKCAEWLAYCLEIGFSKEQLDELESIWWKHKDGYGNLKQNQHGK